MSNSVVDRAGFGPLEGQEFVVTFNANLGTTAAEVVWPAAMLVAYPDAKAWRLKIYNPSAANTLAWATATVAGVSSTITADFAATAGSHIAPGQVEYFAIQGAISGVNLRKLWLVASAAGQSASVTISPVT